MDAAYVTNKAVSLLKQLHGITLGAKEFSGGFMPERCDALLFNSSASFMVETKVTRSDFLADAKKPHRNSDGVGMYRYYACPEGLIKPEELPEKWGLIYTRDKNRRALMPVGYGGLIKTGEEKDPQYGWTRNVYERFGTPRITEDSYDHKNPLHPHNFHKLPVNWRLEWQYIYALATRYKNQKFMGNLI